jgi:excisionase family DNA binding protein
MKLLTVRETAKQLGLASKTVRELIKCGSLRGVRIGRLWRVDQDDLAFFVDGVERNSGHARRDKSPQATRGMAA